MLTFQLQEEEEKEEAAEKNRKQIRKSETSEIEKGHALTTAYRYRYPRYCQSECNFQPVLPALYRSVVCLRSRPYYLAFM